VPSPGINHPCSLPGFPRLVTISGREWRIRLSGGFEGFGLKRQFNLRQARLPPIEHISQVGLLISADDTVHYRYSCGGTQVDDVECGRVEEMHQQNPKLRNAGVAVHDVSQ
jgi:hypothetical protein